MSADLIMFLSVVAVLTITPGADMALVTRQTLTHGRAAAYATVAGIICGLLVHATLSLVGLSALIANSPTAFSVVKVLGAAYLLILGATALWKARPDAMRRTPRHAATPDDAAATLTAHDLAPTGAHRSAFLHGMMTNLLNAKVILLYLTFLPQMIHPGDNAVAMMAFYALLQIALCLVWLTFYVSVLMRARELLRTPRVERMLERATGIALVAFGLRLATAAR